MKKIITLVGLFLVVVVLAGCGQQQVSSVENKKTASAPSGLNEQQKYDVLNWMSSASATATICAGEKEEILAGIGGEKMCNLPAYNWPIIKICGSNPSDTKWIVTKGKSSNWSITLNCSGYVNCNGQTNAVCNASGCTFNKGCDPNKK